MNLFAAIAAAFVVGCAAMFFIVAAANAAQNRRRKTRKPPAAAPKKRKKAEFTKIVILLVLSTYFIGVFIGGKIVMLDFEQLGVYLAFIGAPTPIAIGFYVWKAKAENIIKIKNANPAATEGIPIDLNNINT